MSKERYNIYFEQYSIITNNYSKYIMCVETEDIFHEIGKLVCTSICSTRNIRYTKPQASKERCEELFKEKGYRKISNTNTWIKEKKEDNNDAKT